MGSLFALFVVVPAVELALLIEIGRRIGTLETILLIFATGALGAALARQQGLRVLRQVQIDSAAGRMPADALVDGVLILVAAALLVTPGVLTDAFGFACLVPATRALLRRRLQRWLSRRVQQGDAHVDFRVTSGQWETRSGPVYDVTPEPPSQQRAHEDPSKVATAKSEGA